MFGRRRKVDDFSAEIDAHLQLEFERQRGLGLSEEDAWAAARRVFGNVTQAKERFYESRRWLWWDHFRQDVRYGMRMLRKSPGFTVIAILTLAIGIGANTALFSVVNGVLLNPLPFAEPGRLVALFAKSAQFDKFSISYPNFLDWSRQNHSFSSLAAFRGETFTMTGMGGGWPIQPDGDDSHHSRLQASPHRRPRFASVHDDPHLAFDSQLRQQI